MRRLALGTLGQRSDIVFGLATMAIASAAAILVLEVWRGNIHVPFAYSGDANLNLMLVKGILENGWYLENAQLGAVVAPDLERGARGAEEERVARRELLAHRLYASLSASGG